MLANVSDFPVSVAYRMVALTRRESASPNSWDANCTALGGQVTVRSRARSRRGHRRHRQGPKSHVIIMDCVTSVAYELSHTVLKMLRLSFHIIAPYCIYVRSHGLCVRLDCYYVDYDGIQEAVQLEAGILTRESPQNYIHNAAYVITECHNGDSRYLNCSFSDWWNLRKHRYV